VKPTSLDRYVFLKKRKRNLSFQIKYQQKKEKEKKKKSNTVFLYNSPNFEPSNERSSSRHLIVAIKTNIIQ